MLVELSIVPVGGSRHLSDFVSALVHEVHESGLAYTLTPSGTVIEGDWDEVMPVVRSAHKKALSDSGHLVTTIRIEDESGGTAKLSSNIQNVEEKLGHPARRDVPEKKVREAAEETFPASDPPSFTR
jgi:uncharacterized protein (TIGR00106 family)